MNRAIEGGIPKNPEPGQPDTVTISLTEYRLLTDIADTVIKMGRALEDSRKPKAPMGFQPPSSESILSDSEPQA